MSGPTMPPAAGDLNVRDFGAVGDGATDDTAAIQKALDQAGRSGATVFFPAGVYSTGTVRVPPHVGLVGSPTWDYRSFGGAVLRLCDPAAKCLLDLTGAFGATVNGLNLDGAKLGRGVHGILVDKPDYGKQEDTPRIERCRIGHFTGDGIRLERIWCFTVRGCQVCFCEGDGLRVRGWDGFVLDNWFSGNGGFGYAARDENASVTMTANRVEWNRQGGILVRGGNNYNLTGNYIDRSGGPGIALVTRPTSRDGSQVVYPRDITVTGNMIYRSGKTEWRPLGPHESCHIQVDHGNGLVITGNTMTVGRDDDGKGEWSPRYGLILGNLNQSLVQGNVLRSGATEQLLLDLGGHSADSAIRDNIGSVQEKKP
jgi:hypothetical protein